MKFLLFIMLLFITSVRAQETDQSSFLSGAQQAEQIIQKCTSPKWNEYEKDTSVWSDYRLKDIMKEEIECKEKAFTNALKTILPDRKNREEVVHLYQEYKTNFLKMYGLISTKNSFCGEEPLGCGMLGKIANTMQYNTALDNLITYTLERRDGTY